MRRWNKRRLFAIINRTVHEESTHDFKFGTLEWFGKYLGTHEFHRAISEIELS
jgi:hypothetical protein